MNIRRATLEDAFRVASIHVDSWKKAYREIIPRDYIERITHQTRLTYWKEVLATNNLAVFVYVDDAGNILGWAATGPDREEPDVVTTAEIQAMYVDPEHIGKGIGSRLLEYIVAELVTVGTSRVTVWVLERNEPAMRFYHTRGFLSQPIKSIMVERGGVHLVELKLEMRLAG
ncbi:MULTISPECIES: GNAT family N-acetyltransferase [Burkholderia]|uniref:GNAT family N-acetyltransferase n=1 Tax=Burkholderia TaxID=32008 RepID=UPI0008418A42|nr:MULTISPECIES: GNAT family N-acetyltransferase [unclassified Burkholderia]AOK30743.1 GCN5 family acetyltransferase [Burkholderia sp. Bp7605]